MKKNILLVAVALFAGYNLLCSKENEMSDLVLANVEALSNSEIVPDCEPGGNGCYSDGCWFAYEREAWWA